MVRSVGAGVRLRAGVGSCRAGGVGGGGSGGVMLALVLEFVILVFLGVHVGVGICARNSGRSRDQGT